MKILQYTPFGLAIAGVSKLIKGPKTPGPIPQPTRDDAADQQGMLDQLRRRKGAAADILTGAGGAGAEAITGPAPSLTGM